MYLYQLTLNSCAVLTTLIAPPSVTGRHRPPSPRPKATITRWFNQITYAAGSNLTRKAEAVAYSVDKCKQYYTRASAGIDLGYGSALYNAVNQSNVMTVFDFANFSNIFLLFTCIDANNPPGEPLVADLTKSADFSLNLPAATYARGGCGFFPGKPPP
jgi:hypothetical protein